MERSLLWVLCLAALEASHLGAQSCTANVPSTLSGFSGQQYSISYSGLSTKPYEVQYITDAYGNYNPGLGPGSERGISLGPTTGPTAFVLPINSSWNANGPRLVTANVYDVLGNLLATCNTTATSANAWPIASNPTLSVATSTPVTSNWTGTVTITPTVGSVGSDTLNCTYYIDGLALNENAPILCTLPALIYTTHYSNGSHVVCLNVLDQTSGQVHTPGYEGQAGEWCRTITFANGTTPMSVSLNSDKVYLAPSGTFTLTANTLNTDGTITAGSPVSTPQFYSTVNTAVATVGQTSGVVTAVANNSTYVYAFVPFVHGTDLTTVNTGGNATSVSNPFNYSMAPINGIPQWGCDISSGTGFTPGFYVVNTVQYLGGTYGPGAIFGATFVPSLPPNPPGASGATYDCGPIAQSWIFVWPTNTLPYIGSDGIVTTSYNPANAAVMHEIYAGINLLIYDPYPYQGQQFGAAYEFNNIGKWWAFEVGAGCPGSGCSFTDTAPTSGTYAAWQTALDNANATNIGYLRSQPNDYLYLNWTNITGANVNTYGAAAGPGASLSPPALQTMIQKYVNTGKVFGGYWHDEVPQGCVGCGPIVYDAAGTGAGQSWLISITATGGGGAGETCTAAIGPNGYSIFGNFIVHGSAITNMNSAYPATYAPVAGSGTFHFTCPNVADGTYNHSNDPGFTLEPLSNGWVNSGGAYVPYNSWALMRSQINAVTGHFGFSGTPAGDNIGAVLSNGIVNANSVNNSFKNWSGASPYSVGGTQAADYSDVYSQTGAHGYLVSRAAITANVSSLGWLGWTLRYLYGAGYSPSLPMNALTQGTMNYYGIKGVPASLTSCVGNLCTFSAPVNTIIPNILPGISRLYVTGATDVSSPQDTTNNNFVLVDCPTATTCHVDLAATDTVATGTGGTITTQDGTTVVMGGGMTATGSRNQYNSGETLGTLTNTDRMTATNQTGAGSATTLLRKRGQTFSWNGTATGTGAAYFNNNTFRIIPDWLSATSVATAPNNFAFYRQLPVLNSTGGTAFIIPDNNYIKGRNSSTGPGGQTVGPASSGSGDTNPEWMFVNVMECIYLRCSGERIYQIGPESSGFNDAFGMTAPGANLNLWGPTVFSSNQTIQTVLTPHYENSAAVPAFKAHEFAALYWNRNVKYWHQPRLNAPSIGKPGEVECGAAGGSYGDILGCTNATDGTRTVVIPTTPYLQSGQNFYWQTVDAYGIGAITILSAGTTSATVTLRPGQAVSFVFPANFAVELQQPTIAAPLADVANANQVVVRYSYDPYYLDAAGTVYNCGAAVCTPGWDRNLGAIYFRLIYLSPSSQVLATSAVLAF